MERHIESKPDKLNIIMNIKIVIYISLAIVFFSACNSGNNKAEVLSEKEQLIQDIGDFEKELFSETEADSEKAKKMIDLYISYTETYPEDTASAEYLFKASEIAMNFEQPHNAIRYLSSIETNYADFGKYSTTLFMKAFIYENYIGDIKNARIYYTRFIEEYPNHAFAKDAEAALIFLGTNEDQLIELFQDINKYDT